MAALMLYGGVFFIIVAFIFILWNWLYYFVIGAIFGLIGIVIGFLSLTIQSKSADSKIRRNAKKAKAEIWSTFVVEPVVFGSMVFFAWPLFVFFYYFELEAKRRGAPYGLGGGGFIFAERSWWQLIKDEIQGKEGEQP